MADMSWAILAAAVVPPATYLAATFWNRGFVRQPRIVMACTSERFASQVEHAGGIESVRTGVRIDLGFIVALTVPSGLVLLVSSKPSLVLVAALAALVDLVEDRILLTALKEPRNRTLRLLAATALAKYAAYLGLVAAVCWAVRAG